MWPIVRGMTWFVRQPWIYGSTIAGFESAVVPPESLLFVGSSTIRLWSTLARDLPSWPIVNRGFGGAVVSQVTHFAARLVPTSPPPRAVLFYCGGNDLAWGVTVDDVVAGVERFVAITQARLPDTPIYLLSVAKTPSRFLSWRRVDALDERLRSLCDGARVRWVDVNAPMLDARGRPRRSLYLFDGIHPSAEGYAVWTSVLRPRLEADLPPR